MKALITGIDGFVGGHTARYLASQPDIEVFGTALHSDTSLHQLSSKVVAIRHLDLTDADAVTELLSSVRPDQIYHLAAQSFVPISFENPWATLENNIHAQLNILHSAAILRLQSRILVVGSAEEYGQVGPDEPPVTESHSLHPTSPYAVSKVAQDMLGLQYFLSHGVAAIRVRPFNHIGPAQNKRFVAASFASQIAAIENGEQEPVITVGNLDAQRDLSDVRDIVRAYWLLLRQGEPGEVYNVGSGTAHSVQEVLRILLNLSSASIEIRVDPVKFRPGDSSVPVCDCRKLQLATGWKPVYKLSATLADILSDWRMRVSQSLP